MTGPGPRQPGVPDPEAGWARHAAEWRHPAQVTSQWRDAADTDPALLRHRVSGDWWDLLAAHDVTLLVSREYEHLVLGLSVTERGPTVTFQPMPHPSGIAIDRPRGVVHIASTRNPNQVFDFKPVDGLTPRDDADTDIDTYPLVGRPLVPVASRFYPGSLYLHDLALIGGELYANAVGENAIVRLASADAGHAERVWWPRSIETQGAGPRLGQNHLQLNSIAAGDTLEASYFTASAARPSRRRPGHRDFPVDGRGVIFAGATREPIAAGLTRPHSARLHAGALWVDNSGYGEVGVVDPASGRFEPVRRLPGWTRGLCFHGGVAFVGVSRVLPRFRQYAPGLDVERSVCGVYAIDVSSGALLGSIIWPAGNQIFAIEWAPRAWTTGFAFSASGRRATARERTLFYTFNLAR